MGFCTRSIRLAIVKVFPDPVTPSKTLVLLARENAGRQLGNRLRLMPAGLKGYFQLERRQTPPPAILPKDLRPYDARIREKKRAAGASGSPPMTTMQRAA